MRRLGFVLLFLALALVLLGARLLFYAPHRSDRYLWGAAHVHSSLSDGRASIDELARAAARARLAFVMLSDHGAPNREAALVKKTIEGVRVIGGSEVRLPEGSLVVSDVDTLTPFKLPPHPPDAIADVRKWGGLAILGAPDEPTQPWTYWDDDLLPDGIEILDLASDFRALSWLAKLRWAWFSLFRSEYLVSTLSPPTRALEHWDELLERGPVWGFYATNAHGGFPLTEKTTETAIPFPSYETAFSTVALGVDREYGEDPMRAIRRGDFFMLVRGAGEPERFTFRAGDDAPAGSFVSAGTRLHVVLEAPGLTPRIVLKRGGEIVAETTESELDFDPERGVYRVEVYLENHPLLASDVPWLLSNPIFVGVSYPPVAPEELVCSQVDPIDLDGLALEKDRESGGSIEVAEDGAMKLWFRLSRATEENPDRWVAFAVRRPLDFSAYRGIQLEADVPRALRLWIELRSGESGHYASIELEEGANRVTVPWSRFYATSGARERPALGKLDALFLAINVSNSYTGIRRAVTLTSFGGCR
jgi:hypothetical protein